MPCGIIKSISLQQSFPYRERLQGRIKHELHMQKRSGENSGPFHIQILLPAAEPSPMASQEVLASTASPATCTSILGGADLMAALSGS